MTKVASLFGLPVRPFSIRGDNKGSIQSIKNFTHTKHTKHIEIHHEFMKERYQNGDIDYEHIPGKDNPADMFTKPLAYDKFQQFRLDIGMWCVD